MKKKKYLVTGGNGFIGSALVRRLINEGYKARVLDNYLRGNSNRLKAVSGHIELINGDVRDGKAVRKAVKGVDAVCHLAYLNGTEFFYTKPELVLDIGVKGIVNVIDGCVREGVKELILMSSSEVYQTAPLIPTDENISLSIPNVLNPRYSYAGGKIISELMAINYGRKYFKKVLIVRPHNVYGPDMGWEHVIPQFIVRMKKLCAGIENGRVKFPIQGTGKETRAFIFIEDFIDAFLMVMKKGKHLGVYNIGTDREITIEKVAREVAAYFGKEILLMPGNAPRGGVSRRCPDITKIRKFGFAPKYPFAKGLSITAEWYDKNMDMRPLKSARRLGHEGVYSRTGF